MKSIISTDGINWTSQFDTGDGAKISITEIRREKTGVHALVGILIDGNLLAHDTFNIGRNTDRRSLVRSAFESMGEVHQGMWPRNVMQKDLDIACLLTPRMWETDRIEITSYEVGQSIPDTTFAIKPFILQGGGTVLYAPPGSSKSYLSQSMGLAIVNGDQKLWDVDVASPVLYVNLERSPVSFQRREMALRRAMGVSNGAQYLHGRGMTLRSLHRAIRTWLEKNGGGGLILDSISRAGLGDLNSNETANSFVDMMHSLEPAWWLAIGHTPRDAADHIYGSVHFDAGEDIGVKVASQSEDGVVGVSLTITKANDIGYFHPTYIALNFNEPDQPVVGIRRADSMEFPELAMKKSTSTLEKAMIFVQNQTDGKASISQIAKGIGADISNLSKAIRGSSEWVYLGNGDSNNAKLWGLKSHE